MSNVAGQSTQPIEDAGPTILGATLTVTLAALATVAMRLFVRINMIRNVGWDDYVMIATMVLNIVGQIFVILSVHYGAGRHIHDLKSADFQEGFKFNFITQPLYLWAICLAKVSIGFFLLRVAVTHFYRRIIMGIMVFMALYTFGCFLTIVLQCTNLAVQWDRTVQGTCWSSGTLKGLSYTNLVLNITTDLMFAVIIPIPMLWHVQMSRRQKGSIIGILGLGIFATAAGLVRASFVHDYGRSGDWLWDSRNLTVWTVVESNIGVVAGNLPCLKPLFKTILGSTYARGSRNRTVSKHFSKPYGPGTGHGHSVKNYDSLASSRTQEELYSKNTANESYMMKTIDINKKPSANDVGNISPDDIASNRSLKSEASLSEYPFVRLGGITKTTEVNVSHDVDNVESHDEGIPPERKPEQMV